MWALQDILGILLGWFRGARYKKVNGVIWVKEKGRNWETLYSHIRREHL